MAPRPGDRERLAAAFRAPEPPTPEAGARANAVLIPIFDADDAGGGTILYTRRAETLTSHPGQVSFPGGRMDPGDDTLIAAALRETQEEIGVDPSRVGVLGHVHDMVTYYGAFVRAFAGHVDGPPPDTPASPDEVSEILLAPVEQLLAPERYECRRMRGDHRVVHYFHTDAALVWGITGELTARFLARAYSWSPGATPRLIDDIGAFLPENS